MGIAGPLPPFGLTATGPSTLLMLGRGSPPVPNRAVGAYMGVAGPLPPSSLSVTGPSTLLLLGRGSPPVPNRTEGAHMGVARPLPPSDLSVIGPSTLLLLGRGSPPVPDTVCFDCPVDIGSCQEKRHVDIKLLFKVKLSVIHL